MKAEDYFVTEEADIPDNFKKNDKAAKEYNYFNLHFGKPKMKDNPPSVLNNPLNNKTPI